MQNTDFSDHDLLHAEVGALGELLRQRKISAVELMDLTLARIEALDPVLHAFTYLSPELAREQAQHADILLASGRGGPLAGIPIAVKDLFWTMDQPTSAGMPVNKDFRASEDATAVRRLREAGGLVFGKLAMPEGAAVAHHPDFGPAPVNPWHADLWTGVSSSGSGVAVAAGMCAATLGSDTGGSIRFPSAMNGVTGLMPSWGRISRYGTMALAPSLDHMGPMARSARDMALLYAITAGHDPKDPTSWAEAVAPVCDPAAATVEGVRMGVMPDAFASFCDREVVATTQEAGEILARLGAQQKEVTLPSQFDEARIHAFTLIAVEAALAHQETFASHAEVYGRDLANLIVGGQGMDVVAYEAVCAFRRELRGVLDTLFAKVDALLLPVMPYAAPSTERLGSLAQEEDPHTRMMSFTVPFNMCGLPSITLPCRPTAKGHPLGFQIVAGRGREDLLLQAAMAFQQETGWHKRRPPI